MVFEWTEQHVDNLRDMWSSGATARQIAEKIGHGITRNAVIGKANRLGLSSPDPKRRRRIAPRPVNTASEKNCQWPIGHPDEEDFHFCGEKTEPERPYCHTHCDQAYRRKS